MSKPPENYIQWLNCISTRSGIDFNRKFVTSRIQVLSDINSKDSQALIKKYGKEHYERVKGWFIQALDSM